MGFTWNIKRTKYSVSRIFTFGRAIIAAALAPEIQAAAARASTTTAVILSSPPALSAASRKSFAA